MLKTLTRVGMAALVAISLGISSVPARADQGEAIAGGIVSGANAAIKNAMDAKQQAQQKKQQESLPGNVAQVPPVNQQPVGGQAQAGLPTGFNYFADFSIAQPYGDIGNKTNWLPGGFDAMASYGFNPANRIVASYYELQHYPYGFNSGTVNTYLPPSFPASVANPAATALASQNLDLTTKDKFLLLSFEHLFLLNMGSKVLPVVITPTYVARSSYIAQSGNGTDQVPFVNQLNGEPETGVDTRTAQYDSIAFTVPFLKTPKMFGTFTAAPTWLVHLAGVNQTNSAQIYQILYLEYNYNKNLRFFLEPEVSRDYLPTDYYPQHLVAYFLGATQRVGKYGFVQAVLNSGGPTNYSPYGIAYLKCYSLPCSQNTVPAIGGLKATQLQLQFGIGSPVVLPF
jgi:hypothetical protein